ncbi:MAG: response regulator [Candidatus Omnitrophica bacterium]|nr:response regulator [Candidatus Omnitrophota bacterium]
MGKKILVVEDEPHIRMSMEARLKANGYVVVTAENGQEGCEKAKTEKPDLILMDVMMPGLDGYQALAKLKEGDKTKTIPVIMLTARAQPEDVEKAGTGGATDYVVKPFTPATLLEKIKKAIT